MPAGGTGTRRPRSEDSLPDATPAARVPGVSRARPCLTRDRAARAGTSIRAVTTTLTITTSAPSSIDADAVVIGVIKGQDGPVLAPGAADLDQALGGGLAATLATLGATGQAEEVTRLPGGGPVTALVIAAVGLGPDGNGTVEPETLRRAAGAAVRTLTAASRATANGDGGGGGPGSRSPCPLPSPPRPRRSPSARCWAATRSPGTGRTAGSPPRSPC